MKNWYLICLLPLFSSCQTNPNSSEGDEALIIETLQKETEYFCERNLRQWEEQWSKQAFVSKMYTGNTNFKEFIGWEEIRQNTVDHIRDFPDPIPVPDVDHGYNMELFGRSAFVFYTKKGKSGPVRETRFLVKEGGKWKIARMQTIY